MNFIPVVIEQNNGTERAYDIYSRLLMDRIILLTGEINDELANTIIACLLFLASLNDDDISLYINSPGGSITAGLAILDTMNYIKPDVSTICVGSAASMGAFLLANGKKGKRYALKNSEIMIHQPLGGFKGQASEIKIHANHILKIKDRINEILSKATNKPKEIIELDTERDYFMDANEALNYGLIDKILNE